MVKHSGQAPWSHSGATLDKRMGDPEVEGRRR
jgi:hypothetical protein